MKKMLALLPLLTLGCAAAGVGAVTPAARWAASLEARPEFPEIRATANAVRTPGTTTVQLELSGSQPGARYPWHVHRGSCGSGGSIVGDPAGYPVLEVDAAGRGLATAVLETELESGEVFHVNVHRSADDLGTIIACGDLREVPPM